MSKTKEGIRMPRPRKWRKVCCLPQSKRFGPLDLPEDNVNSIKMTVDEYETIRLIDLDRFTQEECANQMNVSRTTVQGIYDDARKKLAASLVNGKVLWIEGGEYQLCNDIENGCGRGCCRRSLYGLGLIKTEAQTQDKETNMKIAIPVDEQNLESNVCISFGRSPYFLIYTVETKEAAFLENEAASSQGGAGIKAAQVLVDNEIKTLLTPRCGENAEAVLHKADIAIYKTIEGTAQQNIEAFIEGTLSILNVFHAGHHGHGN